MAELISIEEARGRVLASARRLPAEDVPVADALGRVTAEPVTSPIDVPPFDSSAMDGYALRAGPAAELRVEGEARAGHPAPLPVAPGSAMRISTGAAVPAGADAVVPVERSEEKAGAVRVPATAPGDNIRRAGEDVRAGETILPAGRPLGPAALGVAASVGHAELRCARRPRVGLLVTGDELMAPGEPLRAGAIYSSNGVALAALVTAAGGHTVAREAVPDNPQATRDSLGLALEAADVVIISGGVSVGPHDHVKGALADLGVDERFWGVRLRPGKPTWFGCRGSTLAFGLPGNPVSAMVTFHLFVRAALAALQGADPAAERVEAVLDSAVPRRPSRDEAVRVRLRHEAGGLRATPTGPQGSHILTSMLAADGLALIAAGRGEVAAGELVQVELL